MNVGDLKKLLASEPDDRPVVVWTGVGREVRELAGGEHGFVYAPDKAGVRRAPSSCIVGFDEPRRERCFILEPVDPDDSPVRALDPRAQ